MLESWSLLSRMIKANHRRIFSDYGFSVCLPLRFLPAVCMNQQSASCNLPLPWGSDTRLQQLHPNNPPTKAARVLSLPLNRVCILRLGYNFQNSKAQRLNWKMMNVRKKPRVTRQERAQASRPSETGLPRTPGILVSAIHSLAKLTFSSTTRAKGNEVIHIKC